MKAWYDVFVSTTTSLNLRMKSGLQPREYQKKKSKLKATKQVGRTMHCRETNWRPSKARKGSLKQDSPLNHYIWTECSNLRQGGQRDDLLAGTISNNETVSNNPVRELNFIIIAATRKRVFNRLLEYLRNCLTNLPRTIWLKLSGFRNQIINSRWNIYGGNIIAI